ncbi:MAG: polyprenyl synthetase family protein [Chloracidobacterium sp.]|nr:polyprenyl synthetase family protein [Chloracidobacterium sp.]
MADNFLNVIEIDDFLAESARVTDESLDKLIPQAETEPRRLHEAIRWSLFAGGKRFRPGLVFAVGQIFDAPVEKLVGTASAVEMIHTYSLIHDDLPSMDDDDLRRGRETCHKKFDEATAILAGDVLETLAFQTIANDRTLSAEMRVEIISELAAAAGTPHGMVAGQQLDLEAEGMAIAIGDVEHIHRLKTGALIAACGKAGALIGGGTEDEVATITEYSESLGLLFQITDDLLDVTQSTEDLGKTARKDIAANKATYPSVFGVEASSALARDLCDNTIAKLDNIARPTELLAGIARHILNRCS